MHRQQPPLLRLAPHREGDGQGLIIGRSREESLVSSGMRAVEEGDERAMAMRASALRGVRSWPVVEIAIAEGEGVGEPDLPARGQGSQGLTAEQVWGVGASVLGWGMSRFLKAVVVLSL